MPSIGVDDTRLRRADEAVNQAVRAAGEKALAGGGTPVVVNQTNIANNFANENPERTPPDLDLGE